MVFGMAGCGDNEDSKKEEIPEKIDVTTMDAEAILNKMVDSGIPIGNIIVATEENDQNKLLNRPTGYTSKVNFADRRIEQTDLENPIGGTIEVFGNEEDAKARFDYVDTMATDDVAQHLYLYGNIVMRIDQDLTAEQLMQYETAFTSLQEGNDPASVEYTPTTVKEKMIYHGYQISTDKMYSKKVDEYITYHFDFTNGTFRITNEEDETLLRSFNWGTYENYGDTKTVFYSELETMGLEIDELNQEATF